MTFYGKPWAKTSAKVKESMALKVCISYYLMSIYSKNIQLCDISVLYVVAYEIPSGVVL